LLAEVVSGALIGVAHHKFGNVDFRWRSNHLRVALLLGLSSIIGVVIAVFIAVRLPTTVLETYIGLLILFIGVVMLFTLDKRFRFSWSKILALGVFAAFNKGISGGGYGPLVTGGQLLTGLNGKQAVAITSLAKSLACITGIVSYLILSKGTDWGLAPSLVIGAAVSVPFSAFIVKRMYERSLRVFIGILTIGLGLSILVKIFLF
ncbi:MAG TPA: sulfite exporter TauE/SafE family protein, partial [Thermoplasmatales archaeon]|nr:sulfite exporter TauE/SafE family protein [Thermoplasmatales archaeon]